MLLKIVFEIKFTSNILALPEFDSDAYSVSSNCGGFGLFVF